MKYIQTIEQRALMRKIEDLKIGSGKKEHISKLFKRVDEVKDAKIIYFNGRYTF